MSFFGHSTVYATISFVLFFFASPLFYAYLDFFLFIYLFIFLNKLAGPVNFITKKKIIVNRDKESLHTKPEKIIT